MCMCEFDKRDWLFVIPKMPFVWKRPSGLVFPQVFHEFEARDRHGDATVKFRIEDLQSDRFDEALDIMRDKHILDEPMYSAKGVRDDPDSLREMTENWRNMLQQKISLVCYKDGSEEIVAVNVLGVVTETEFDAPHKLKGKPWAEVNNLKAFLKKNYFDPFAHYGVDRLMFAAGLYVSESYRNRGIAVEMMKAREAIGTAAGIRVSSNVFSSLGAQKAAVKCGFEESFCIRYADLPGLTPDGHFPNIKDEFLRIMSKKFF